MPHIDSAYSLARWLTRNGSDAEDVVQEAMLRAFRFIDSLRAEDGRAWLLSIVRRAAIDWRNRQRGQVSLTAEDGGDIEMLPDDPSLHQPVDTAEMALIAAADRDMVQAAIADLPESYRIILQMREIEDMPYRDIAEAAAIPIGTVMSRLARARLLLRDGLAARIKRDR